MARLLAAVAAIVLLVAAIAAVTRSRDTDSSRGPGDPPPATESSRPPASPDTTPAPEAADLLTDPTAAERAGAEAVLAAGLGVAERGWSDLGNPVWAAEERPVYVATARLPVGRDAVTADVVIAARTDVAVDEVVLRLLPAAEALEGAGGDLQVSVRLDGTAAPHVVDHAGARLIIDTGGLAAGEAYLLRVDLDYAVVPRTEVTDDGGPAGFGLLAWNPDATFLGHWLPLLTFASDAGPMIPWGDVGAFPAAVWSLVVEHEGVLVTGGQDGECPRPDATCTWARGVALRDVSAVAYDADAVVAEAGAGELSVRTVVPPLAALEAAAPRALDEALSSVGSFTRRFGPLAWNEFDVAVAPLSSGAAGMEFPGLVVIDQSSYPDLGGGFGSFVLGHEVAHQWFHALVGNGSLSNPVVDESLAQYLTYLWYRDEFGPSAAEQMSDTYFVNRYNRFQAVGGIDEPPAQALDQFAGSTAYGPLVYARAPLGWVTADTELGEAKVVAFLQQVVGAFGLGVVTADGLLDAAAEFDAELAVVLEHYWTTPGPVG